MNSIIKNSIYLLICLTYIILAFMLPKFNVYVKWAGSVFFGLGAIIFTREIARSLIDVRHSIRNKKSSASHPSDAANKHTIPLPMDTVDAWKKLISGTELNWVVFSEGTLVFVDKKFHTEASANSEAKNILSQYKEVGAGSALGDFSIIQSNEYAVWVVRYSDPNVFSFIRKDEVSKETVAGLLARQARTDDANKQKIIHTEIVE